MHVLLSTLSRKASVPGRKKTTGSCRTVFEVHHIPWGATPEALHTSMAKWSRKAKVCNGALQGAFAPPESYRNNFSSAKDLKFKSAVVSERETMIPPHLLQTKHLG